MLPKDPREATIALGLAATLILIWTSLFSLRGPGLFYEPQPSLQLLAGEEKDSQFLHQAFAVEFPSPMNHTPIRDVCLSTSDMYKEGDGKGIAKGRFRPGLLFSCENQHGGLGMVRNQLLKCIRYAIHAGAALIVPSMAKRNDKDIADIETSTAVPLEYLFDREMFIAQLEGACPGMRLFNSAEEFPFYEERVGGEMLGLELVGDEFEPGRPREGIEYPEKWRGEFDDWLDNKGVRYSAEKPVHVKIGQAYLEYNVHSDSPDFVSEFGKILSFRADTRALAARVLLQIKVHFGLDIDPSRAVNGNAFFGAHLRLEKDAIEAWTVDEGWVFSEREKQFESVWSEVKRSGLGVVYVATGEEEIVRAFEEYVARKLDQEVEDGDVEKRRDISIVTKHTLLSGSERDLAKLDKMTFDQQALVDFLIMFKASFFAGVAHSSFPWTVALRRHELSTYRDERGLGYENLGSDILRDELSVILGERAEYPYVDPFEWGLWP
ncbi:hypothetical protein VTL71DRAFT_13419 [Oculimacula yallundae]|uniref:Alternative oxidase n=1 Tax=Oculimacula yallundae TaxID=86028 RepID=A0ABR4CKF7_9HELO